MGAILFLAMRSENVASSIHGEDKKNQEVFLLPCTIIIIFFPTTEKYN